MGLKNYTKNVHIKPKTKPINCQRCQKALTSSGSVSRFHEQKSVLGRFNKRTNKEESHQELGMGWVWRDDSSAGNDFTDQQLGDSAADRNCSATKLVRSQCKTEEVEPGKFVRKCEKTEEILRHCLGKPSEVIQSTTEHTEEDVTDHMAGKSALSNQFEENPLNFPGLRDDIDTIERHFLSGMKSFFEAAEEMKSSLFDITGDHHTSTRRRGIHIEDHPKIEEHRNDENAPRQPYTSGEIDLSGLAKDV